MKRCSSRSASTASRSFAARPRARAGARRQQQLGDLLRDRRAALDDAAARRGSPCAARSIAIGIDAGMRQNRRSSAATVAATSSGGRRSASSRTLRVPSLDSAS